LQFCRGQEILRGSALPLFPVEPGSRVVAGSRPLGTISVDIDWWSLGVSRSLSMPYDDTLVVGYLRQTHGTTLLTEREKHLIGLAVTMTRGCQICTRNRIEKARAAGIGDDMLNALVSVVSSINAGVTAATAREGFRLADAAAKETPCTDLCAADGGRK
jgi:alkylhydroperoxidase/carboxymuconolactone decarboxylase family protein YurZ